MKKNYSGWMLMINILLFACSPSKQIGRLAKSNILNNSAFAAAHTGISIYEPETQKYWYNYQGDKYFVPASNTKLPTCYAAMKYLGDSISGMRYQQLNDTLFISPTGDPTFLQTDFKDQRVYDLLRNNGKTIALNDALWQEERWGNGWAWNDYAEDYMAERSAMPIYGNLARFKDTLKNIHVIPSFFSNRISADTSQGLVAGEALIRRELSSNTFFLTRKDSAFNNIDVPFYTSDSLLLKLLEDTLHKNVYKNHIQGFPGSTYEKEIYSQPTDSLLRIMMHRSDNFFAEQSLLMVSRKLLGVMNDEKVIDTLLKTDFIDLPQKPGWADGSGLSRYNLFTPQDFVSILNKMKNDFGLERIKNILPTGGTGTLNNYYRADSGYIFAKTGTLSGVVALSGFLITKKNKLLIFSVLVNNHHDRASLVREGIEKFIRSVRNKK